MRNRRVELGVEWQEIAELAEMGGQSPVEILKRFGSHGIHSVIVPEDTISTLEQAGQLTRVPLNGVLVQLKSSEERLLDSIEAALKARNLITATTIPDNAKGTVFTWETGNRNETARTLYTPISYARLRAMGIGLSPDIVESVKIAGLQVVARIGNFPAVTPQSAERVLLDVKAQGANLVIFQGEEVLGYRGIEEEVAKMFRDPETPRKEGEPTPTGLAFGAVEFGKQKGDVQVTTLLRGDYIRVHSIQAAEMAQMTEPEIVERYVRAVRDRNIRFCYVRLLTHAGTDPIEENLRYLDKIVKGTQKGIPLLGGGLELGASKRFQDPNIPHLLFAIMGLGIAAGVVAMLQQMIPISVNMQILALLGVAVVCVGLAWAGDSGRQYVGLLAGIAFPTLACLRIFPRGDSGDLTQREALRRAIGAMILASLITSVGIVLVAALLATRPYMLHAKQFYGIKVQHIVPMILMALLAMVGGAVGHSERGSAFWKRVGAKLRLIGQEPARFGMLLLGLVVLGFFVFVVARTGNDAGVGASGIEMKFRNLTERLLFVRPRTKEYLFGHPALLLGLALWWRGRKSIGLPLFVFGCLGQVSLLNTFCHIHTPLTISLWRNVVGLVLGMGLGAIAFLGYEAILARRNSGAKESA
jgi:hypothetical protein